MENTKKSHRKGTGGPHRRVKRATGVRMTRRQEAESLIRLMKKWLTDESGYDEETLPALKKALQANRPAGTRKPPRD